MRPERLIDALDPVVGRVLALDLVSNFLKIREDVATSTLERAAPGKFVETVVQCLQQIAFGRYDVKPEVDRFLSQGIENEIGIAEGLRVCTARAARLIYTLRNKRSIAHKNAVDPNTPDLLLIHSLSTWIITELVQHAAQLSAAEAGDLVRFLEVPINLLVEEIGPARLVHADVSIRAELLILLHSYYPEVVSLGEILRSTEARNPKSVRNQLNALKAEKLVFGDTINGYRLTRAGHAAAVREISRLFSGSSES